MLKTILDKCNYRQQNHTCGSCAQCSYGSFCPKTCELCLDYIHFPGHAQANAPERKYDCTHMSDFYTCKYSCRYTSEMIYALEGTIDLHNIDKLKVLSFGCGPCTDLFAIDYLHKNQICNFRQLEYLGIDYSENVWKNIHNDIKEFESKDWKIKFIYQDVCDIMDDIKNNQWTPNLIVFQYVFSDMCKHTTQPQIKKFIEMFAEYFKESCAEKTYIVLNDINLCTSRGGGRDFFDDLYEKLKGYKMAKGHFRKDTGNPAFKYGIDSLGEFSTNENFFDITPWRYYSPYDTCASAQMIIKKEY